MEVIYVLNLSLGLVKKWKITYIMQDEFNGYNLSNAVAWFLTEILHRGLRKNDFFFILTNLIFPIFIWSFISLYSLDFYFSFFLGLPFLFFLWAFSPFSLWTFFPLFSLDFYPIPVTFWISSIFFSHFCYCFACRLWKNRATPFDRASPLNSSPFN